MACLNSGQYSLMVNASSSTRTTETIQTVMVLAPQIFISCTTQAVLVAAYKEPTAFVAFSRVHLFDNSMSLFSNLPFNLIRRTPCTDDLTSMTQITAVQKKAATYHIPFWYTVRAAASFPYSALNTKPMPTD